MSTLPVYNPTVPHLSLIPGGLRHGSMIRLKGQMNHGGNRFSVNIQTGAAVRPRDDAHLHLSIRPSENVIVRNHFQRQIWGTEERYGPCTIYPGSTFEIIILAEHGAFKIAINSAHHSLFNHRLPLQTARFVSINGDCTIHSITVEQDSNGGMGIGISPYVQKTCTLVRDKLSVLSVQLQTIKTSTNHTWKHQIKKNRFYTAAIPPPPPPPPHHHFQHRPVYPGYPGGSSGHYPTVCPPHYGQVPYPPPPPPPYTPTPYGHGNPYMQPRTANFDSSNPAALSYTVLKKEELN